MKIESIQFSSNRSGGEVLIKLTDQSTLSLDAEIAVRFRLATGIELSEERLAEITSENEILIAKRKLIAYLALRKKSVQDARRYLLTRGFSHSSTDAAVEAALRLGYLDDKSYTEAFVNTRRKQQKYGIAHIKRELQAKGVDTSVINEITAPFENSETQVEQARAVAAKKYTTLKNEQDLAKAYNKMVRYLAGRGFPLDICTTITREFLGDPTQF